MTTTLLSRDTAVVLDVLRRQYRPIVTSYELFRCLWNIYAEPELYGFKPDRRVRTPSGRQYARVVKQLGVERLIRSDPDFPPPHPYIYEMDARILVFRVSDVPDGTPEDIACLVDPFAFVSHLSAMQRYGLTVRRPTHLLLTSPKPTLWAQRRDEVMYADYGFHPRSVELKFFRPLLNVALPDRLRERPVRVHRTSRPYRSQSISESFARIIEIGDLFAQTLIEPELCGGMSHVLEVWDEHAETYLDLIVPALEHLAMPIILVRAGYILSERLGITDGRVDDWKRFAQRGGSRKLDPSTPYAPVFSEDWMISLNV